jgi:hypothetical protein
MISRRSLLSGLSILSLAGGIAGCAARASTSGSSTSGSSTTGTNTTSGSAPALGGSIPVVSPGARWNGTALSGGTPPVDPARTTAKPAIHWLVPSDLRLVSNLTIGVDADANGGVKQVDFWVEGQVQTVTAPSIYTDTDANGATRNRYGYWITLNASAFNAVSATGEARLYATAVPTDARMQSRVIGSATVTGYDGNYPMSVFPRTVANDWSKTVRLDGAGDYTSLAAAINAARSAAAQAPLITIAQTGFYELANIPGVPTSGNGFCTVTTATGVIATLGRAAAFTPNNPASWSWTPGWDGMEFRGAGIVFDQRNWTQMQFTNKPAWLNGCKFTNSIGGRDTYYWNGVTNPQPGPVLANFSSRVESYWDDVSAEYSNLMFQGNRYVRGCKIRAVLNDIFSGTNYVADNYVRNWDGSAYQPNVTSLTVHYANPGGHTSATVNKTANTLTLSVDGSVVLTLAMGTTLSDTYPTIQSVANAINAFGSGWSATCPARGLMTASALGGENGGSNPTNANAFGVTLNIISALGIHADWWQGYSGSNTRENVIIRGNICRADNTADNNSFLFNDDDNNGAHSFDHIVKKNVWASSATNACPNNYFGGNMTSHYVYENNTMQGLFVRREYINGNVANGPDVGDSVYSSFKNNLMGISFTFGYSGSGSYFPNSPPWINNLFAPGNATAMNGPKDSGNISYGAATFMSLFVDYPNGDFRPKAAGVVLANLKSEVTNIDGRLLPFEASDVVGAWSKDDPAPVYPF